MTVLPLKTYALQTLGAQMGVQQGDATWRALAAREGLRPMTDEERRFQTDEAYFVRNWSLILLKKGLNPNDIIGRVASLMKAAIRGGHPLASAAMDATQNTRHLLMNPDAFQEMLVCAIPREEVTAKLLSMPKNRITVVELDDALLRAVSEGTVPTLQKLISLELPACQFSSQKLSEALNLAAGWGHYEKVVCLMESFKDRLTPEDMGEAYWWAVSIGHIEIAQLFQPHITDVFLMDPDQQERTKADFRRNFLNLLWGAIKEHEIEFVKMFLQQQECKEILFQCGGAQTVTGQLPPLGAIPAEIIELLFKHEQLENEFVLKQPFLLFDLFERRMYKFSVETMARVIQKVCRSVRPIPMTEMLLARELHGTQIKGVPARKDLRGFHRAYGSLLVRAVIRGNIELVTAMLSSDFPRIPKPLTFVFLSVCQANSRTKEPTLSQLRAACHQYFREMAWLLDNVAF